MNILAQESWFRDLCLFFKSQILYSAKQPRSFNTQNLQTLKQPRIPK